MVDSSVSVVKFTSRFIWLIFNPACHLGTTAQLLFMGKYSVASSWIPRYFLLSFFSGMFFLPMFHIKIPMGHGAWRYFHMTDSWYNNLGMVLVHCLTWGHEYGSIFPTSFVASGLALLPCCCWWYLVLNYTLLGWTLPYNLMLFQWTNWTGFICHSYPLEPYWCNRPVLWWCGRYRASYTPACISDWNSPIFYQKQGENFTPWLCRISIGYCD